MNFTETTVSIVLDDCQLDFSNIDDIVGKLLVEVSTYIVLFSICYISLQLMIRQVWIMKTTKAKSMSMQYHWV